MVEAEIPVPRVGEICVPQVTRSYWFLLQNLPQNSIVKRIASCWNPEFPSDYQIFQIYLDHLLPKN
ncbi:hypothetical protein MUP37_04310 [Candidatus Bathyarchaeota archaeon]|nr:hypothetical protein [Candidatus Bathyarchaeota archaeon]